MFRSTVHNLGNAGTLLLLAYIIALPLGLVDQYARFILYLALGLILVSAFDSARPGRILRNLIGRVGGLAFVFWLLLVIFKLAVVPLTSAQLFWTFVAAFVIRAAVEI
ncbi:MAG TPA: hypothetical protein VMS77_08610 [Conexivisphaerales archaeon]|nr:hypothetical protein [Conexivisphaerales archaeon]